MAEQVTYKLLYEMLEKKSKEEQELRHAQTERFTQAIASVELSVDKRFDKLENMMLGFINKAENTFATKDEHRQNKEEIIENKIELKELKQDSLTMKKFMWQSMAIVSILVPVVSFILQYLYN